MLQAFGALDETFGYTGAFQFESHRGVTTDGFMPQGPLPGLLSKIG